MSDRTMFCGACGADIAITPNGFRAGGYDPTLYWGECGGCGAKTDVRPKAATMRQRRPAH